MIKICELCPNINQKGVICLDCHRELIIDKVKEIFTLFEKNATLQKGFTDMYLFGIERFENFKNEVLSQQAKPER